MSENSGMAVPIAPIEMSDTDLAPHLQLRPERLYWSVLETPAGARIRPGLLPAGLRLAFEEDVPAPLAGGPPESMLPMESSNLHLVCAPLGDGRVVACGAPLSNLQRVASDQLFLTPSDLPAFIRDEVDAATPTHQIVGSLNLLVGVLEPAPLRTLRQRRVLILLASVFLIAVLAIIGLDRRARHDRALARQATQSADAAAFELGRTLAAPVRVTPETLPMILAVAQRSAAAAARVQMPRDASAGLAALLGCWPQSRPADNNGWSCTVQSLNIGEDSMAMTLTLEGNATAFLQQLSPPAGWMLEEPRLTNVGRASTGKTNAGAGNDAAKDDGSAHVRISLTLRRERPHALAKSGGEPAR